MQQLFISAVAFAQNLFNNGDGQATLPLLVVGSFAGGSLMLYSLTRGREFLIAGYSSVLFLAPFVHLS